MNSLEPKHGRPLCRGCPGEDFLQWLEASPCGFFRCVWNEQQQDFLFEEVNPAGERIVDLGPLTGRWMAATVDGHRKPLPTEGGLTLLEIYRRVAFRLPPYQSGVRVALLEFNSENFGGRAWFDQTVIQNSPGEITIWCSDVTPHVKQAHQVAAQQAQLEELNKQLAAAARTDSLCWAEDAPVYSRFHFDEALNTAAVHWEKHKDPLTLILIDLDKFKEINDTYGHAAGDEALKEAARRICGAIDGRGIVARIGGDEFAALLEGMPPGQGYEVGLAIAAAVRAPLERPWQLSASVGVSGWE